MRATHSKTTWYRMKRTSVKYYKIHFWKMITYWEKNIHYLLLKSPKLISVIRWKNHSKLYLGTWLVFKLSIIQNLLTDFIFIHTIRARKHAGSSGKNSLSSLQHLMFFHRWAQERRISVEYSRFLNKYTALLFRKT